MERITADGRSNEREKEGEGERYLGEKERELVNARGRALGIGAREEGIGGRIGGRMRAGELSARKLP